MGRLFSLIVTAVIIVSAFGVLTSAAAGIIIVVGMVVTLPYEIYNHFKFSAVIKNAERINEEGRQWMRDNGRGDEISW